MAITTRILPYDKPFPFRPFNGKPYEIAALDKLLKRIDDMAVGESITLAYQKDIGVVTAVEHAQKAGCDVVIDRSNEFDVKATITR